MDLWHHLIDLFFKGFGRPHLWIRTRLSLFYPCSIEFSIDIVKHAVEGQDITFPAWALNAGYIKNGLMK